MAISNVLGTLSPSAGSPEMLQWAQQVSQLFLDAAYLTGGIPGQPGSLTQAFAGNMEILGGGPTKSILGFGTPSLKVVRTPPQSAQGIDSALLLMEEVPKSSVSIEWTQLIQLINRSDAGQNVGLYSQVYKYGQGPSWGITIEAQDFTTTGTSALVGMELGISYGGVDTGFGPTFDGVKEGLYIVYADVAPNGGNPVGPVISVGDCIWVGPGAGVARFHALTLLKAHGCYTRAVMDITNVHDSPYSLAMAGGSAMFFSSGTGGFATPTWYPGTFVPNIVGAIRISVDGSTNHYIPICNNHA